MLPVNCGSHADFQNFVVTNLRKYYPDPSALARSTWDIIERFWNLDLSFTDTFMADKYSKFGPAPRTPSSMQRSYLLSIDFKVTSITEWAAQLKINPLYAILLKSRLRSLKQKARKLILWKKLRLQSFFRFWKILVLNLMNSLILPSLKSTRKSSLMFLYPQDLSIRMLWL